MITAAAFAFMRDLKDHNDRDWFTANKKRYEADLRDPCLRLIAALADRLDKVCPMIEADPRPSGGSLFRIYRDVRFSKDKSPYKTHTGIHLRHRGSTDDVHGPGIYLHLEPGEVFLACGLWQPAPPSLGKIRDAIAADPAAWKKATGEKRFKAAFSVDDGERLKKPPAGYDPAHPCIEDLKRKSFTASAPLSEEAAANPDFAERLVGLCGASTPFMAFLTEAVGLEWR
jgi:uncharacterized protein (TIGR02453 family)